MSTAARPLPTETPTAGGDEFDDLFNYDADANDPFSENYVVPGSKDKKGQEAAGEEKGGDGLGLDEEVEITRKPRPPRVKLDEDRLLSANGIPKLRARAKHHLKFKGKNHEYSDATRLLSFYQLWLDDLFPKARFLDALAMVEKMGHKKRLQVMRMEWINEGKPHNTAQQEGDDDDMMLDEPTLPTQEKEKETTATRVAPIFEEKRREGEQTPEGQVAVQEEEEDLYGATPRAPKQKATEGLVTAPTSSIFGNSSSIFAGSKPVEDEAPPEDELDALLAEEEDVLRNSSGNTVPTKEAAKKAVSRDDFDDEMEAMAGIDMEW